MAGHVNQLLTTHQVSYVYAGALASQQATAGVGSVATNGLYVAQAFTTASAQTTVGYIVLTVSFTGSPTPLGVSLQATSGSGPSGTALASAWLPSDFASSSPGAVTVLLPVTGLASSTQYWVVAAATGDGSDFFSWSKSNQSSGAATSPDGVSWTGQSYGLLFQVWDGTTAGGLTGVYEDSGARTTVYSYTGGGLVSRVQEFTLGQTASGYSASARTLSYSGSLMAGAA